MRPGYDGEVKIDSLLDSSGFNDGVKDIERGLDGVKSSTGKIQNALGMLERVGPRPFRIIATAAKILIVSLGLVAAAVVVLTAVLIGLAIQLGIGLVLAIRSAIEWAQKMTETLYKTLSPMSAMRATVVDLRNSFAVLKASIQAAGATLLNALAPILIKIIEWLTLAVNWLTMFIAALAGQTTVMRYVSGATDDAAKSTGNAAKATDKLADSTERAGKAAKGALAAFDELNVLRMEDEKIKEPEIGGAGAGGAVGGIMLEVAPIDENIMALADRIRRTLENTKQWFIEAWNKIKEVWGVASGWFIDNVWSPVSTWAMKAWESIKSWAIQAWEDIKRIWFEISTWIGVNVISPISAAFSVMVSSLSESIGRLYVGLIVPLIEAAKQIYSRVISPIISYFRDIMEPAVRNVLELFKANFMLAFNLVLSIGKNFLLTITEQIKAVTKIFDGLIMYITGVFTGNWRYAWEGVVKIFSGLFGSIIGLVRGNLNTLIDLVNAMLRGLVNSINTITSTMSSTLGNLPFGIRIPFSASSLSAPQIPRLATGAVIPPNAEFAAILGDQRSGRNLEAPEDLIRQIVREETGSMEANITINFGGSVSELVRILKPYIDKENVRIGNSLIKGNASV